MLEKFFETRERARPSVGLALSGGSTYGIAHIGVLKALVEARVPIDFLSGTSAGALVAGCHAFGMSLDDMRDVVRDLDWKKLSKFGYSRLGLRSNKPLGELIQKHIGDVDISDAPIPLAIVATDIELQERVILRKGKLAEAVRASTCIPGVFTPVEMHGALLVDGSLTENLPLSPLEEMGAEVIIGATISAEPSYVRPKHAFDVVSTAFNILLLERDKHARRPDVHIEPHITLSESIHFSNADDLIRVGYDAGILSIPRIRELLGEDAAQGRKTVFDKLLGPLGLR